MSDDGKTYLTFTGVVQFDIKHRETSKGPLRVAAIRLCNHVEGRIVDVTLWDNSFADLKIDKGDAVIVDGVFTADTKDQPDGTVRTFYNVTPTRIAVIPTVSATRDGGSSNGPRQVANAKKSEEPSF